MYEQYDQQNTYGQQKQQLTCPLCQGQQFRQEEGRLDSKWGFTNHKLTLMICNRCQFVMQFYGGNTIWDFD